MNYKSTLLKEIITIKKIVTVHYFEFAKDYVFEGESHNFWEFVYVDKGEVEVMADMQGYKLRHGDIIFHKPNEFHNLWANGQVAPNLIVVSFECSSKAMEFFHNKIFCTSDTEKNLLSQIIRESKAAFASPLDSSSLTKLDRNILQAVGCEQLLRIYLEQLLIGLIRDEKNIKCESRISKFTKERSDRDIAQKVIKFLTENTCGHLSFKDVSKYCGLGKTNLQSLFKKRTGFSVMEYFRMLKTEEAKIYIRERNMNFTEIAEKLGYESIHYFSRHFKKTTGMTPSQYSLSIKAMI